jgi:uracil-DNA glycosylase family 4
VISKFRDFVTLIDDVHNCKLCDRMKNSARVLGHSAGALGARIMFVGEAPGRLGADQTQIPFHGDVSGGNFEDFLRFADIERRDIFVTNAVLCNPRDEKGNNSPPNSLEIKNCASHLRRQIDLVNPAIVVSLGAVALRALSQVEAHGLELSKDVRTAHAWYGRELVPLYHPGQRALIHRSHANQRSDYQFVAERMRRTGKTVRRSSGVTPQDLVATIKYMLARRGEVSYFALHKYAYLMEYLHVRSTGRRLSGAHFIRQKDGPYCIELQIDRLKKSDSSIALVRRGGKLLLRRRKELPLCGHLSESIPVELAKLADEVIARYSDISEADLKRAVYLTAPMRAILRTERYEKINLYNSTIDFLSA